MLGEDAGASREKVIWINSVAAKHGEFQETLF